VKGRGWRKGGGYSGDYHREGCERKQSRERERERARARARARGEGSKWNGQGEGEKTMGASRVRTSPPAVNQSFRIRYGRTGGGGGFERQPGGYGRTGVRRRDMNSKGNTTKKSEKQQERDTTKRKLEEGGGVGC